MRIQLFAVLVVFLVGGFALATPAYAGGEPTAVVQKSVDEILDVVRSAGGTLSQTGKDKIFSVVDDTFDMKLFSRRTLGRRWNTLSETQQQEFVSLYSQLLKNTYVERIEAYSDEQVKINEEIDLGKNRFEVRTTVVGSGVNVPIFYRLYNTKEGLRVYDVLVEGVSLVNNYRSQVTGILTKGGPEELLTKLREKVS